MRVLGMTALVIVLFAGTSLAEDLSGAKKLLCSPVQASECRRDGCSTGPAWDMDFPPFVEIDLKGKSINTTPSSGDKRTTKIDSVKRDGDLIVLQGYEMGRAYSMVITESSGFATMGITLDDAGVVIFASCIRSDR